MSEPVKFQLPEAEIPAQWVNLLPDLPGEPLPPLNPETREPAGPPGPDPDLPDGPDRAGGLGRARDRDTGGGARGLPALAADSADQGAAPRARARHPGPHLLQVRGRHPAGSHKPNTAVAQAYYNREAGMRKLVTETGAGQWGSALALACRLFGLECEVFMVGVSYRPEALPAGDDRDLGRHGPPQPLRADRGGALPGRAHHREPRDRDLRGGRGGRRRGGHQLRARLGPQPRLPAPDGDRPGGDRRDGDGGGVPGRRRRLRRRRVELRRHRLSVHPRQPARGPRRPASSPPSPPPARR